jgi:hypothetical protein
LCFDISNQWRELEVIPYEDKTICIAEWAETCWEGYLGCFVYNAVIEFSFVENETMLAY